MKNFSYISQYLHLYSMEYDSDQLIVKSKRSSFYQLKIYLEFPIFKCGSIYSVYYELYLFVINILDKLNIN